jgi:hypothetical protein
MMPRSCCISCTPLRFAVSFWVSSGLVGEGDVHAIDDGRKLCIPTGIVKLLSYFARDG